MLIGQIYTRLEANINNIITHMHINKQPDGYVNLSMYVSTCFKLSTQNYNKKISD